MKIPVLLSYLVRFDGDQFALFNTANETYEIPVLMYGSMGLDSGQRDDHGVWVDNDQCILSI